MKAITILRRRVKENLVVCDEYEKFLKTCDNKQKELEEQKRLCKIKIDLIKKENKNIEKSIEIIEGKFENEEDN